MPYATVHLRGKDREIEYCIRGFGPGSGWETDWRWTSSEDRDDFNERNAEMLTEAEEDAVNTAIIIAEGNTP